MKSLNPFSPKTEPLSYLASGVDPHVLQAVVRIAVDLADHGHEGKSVGGMFILGDEEAVIERSHPLILDPLAGHPAEVKNVLRPEMQGTVRELATLDGAFVVSADGVVVSAARCLDVRTGDVSVPAGLGSRHQAAASLTRATKALAVVVSQSSTVRIFYDGQVVDQIRSQRRKPLERVTSSGRERAPRATARYA